MNQPLNLDLAQIPETQLRTAIATAFSDPTLVDGFDALYHGKIEYATKSWSAGGCLMLAEALRRLAGGTLVAFSDVDAAGDSRAIEHVALEVATPDGTQLVDERGYWDDDLSLINYLYAVCDWEDPELFYPGSNVLATWTVETAAAEGLLFDEALCAQLTAILARELVAPAH